MTASLRRRLLVLLAALFLWSPQARSDEKDDQIAADEATLKKAEQKVDGPSLVAFFRKRTLTEADFAKLRELIKQLGDDSFAVREKATTELEAAGRVALPLLKEAANDSDLEVARRAQSCLEKLESAEDTLVVLAAARLLAARKPAGAAEVILAHIPSVEDPVVEEELLRALVAVGLTKGKADDLLVKALADKVALRRAAAVYVVARSTEAAHRTAARERLKDADPRVRWRAAEGLLAAKDNKAIPALIELLADSPKAIAWAAEDQLCRLAGEKTPNVAIGDAAEAERAKAKTAWEAWYKADGVKLDLAKLDLEQRLLGLTLCVAWDSDKTRTGRVFEIDSSGRERWSVEDVNHPVDGHMIRGDRFLVAEQSGMRVTERDLKGKVLWEHKVTDSLVSCKRLANGNTWIVTYSQIMEVTPKNEVLYTLASKHGWISHAARLRNGNIGYMTYAGSLVEIDPKGTEVRVIKIEPGRMGLIKFEQLPNGNFLVPQQTSGKIQELDGKGNVVWSFDMANVSSATRLPNGNLLLSSYGGRKVVEVNRAGKVVWEKSPGAGLLNAARR
jgi:hypothetical protein